MNIWDDYEKVNIDCECYAIDCIVRFSYYKKDEDDWDKDLDVDMVLREGNFWDRLKKGMKYIFMSRDAWTTGACWRPEQAVILREFLDQYIKAKTPK